MTVELSRPPDFEGVARAWRIRAGDATERGHADSWGHGSAGVGADFLIHGPYHPFWNWWYVSIIHLRPIESAPPPHVHFPGATHEVLCLSLDPEPRNGRPAFPDLERIESGDVEHGLPGFLQPADWVVQVVLPSDEEARRLGDLIARHICAGQSCDSDFRGYWERTLATTAEHLRLGGHP